MPCGRSSRPLRNSHGASVPRARLGTTAWHAVTTRIRSRRFNVAPARGYPVPSRRTLTAAILASARSDVPALRHPAFAGHIRRLNGRGNPSPTSSRKPSPSWPRFSWRTSVRSREPVFQPGSQSLEEASGSPCPGSRRMQTSAARMAKRSRSRVSGGQDARSERPATGYGEPEAGAQPNASDV